jgi:hypothetical protein
MEETSNETCSIELTLQDTFDELSVKKFSILHMSYNLCLIGSLNHRPLLNDWDSVRTGAMKRSERVQRQRKLSSAGRCNYGRNLNVLEPH